MARVLISKSQADLEEFGVPRQEVGVRPKVPSIEELEQFNPNVALSPTQYTSQVPLLDRKHWGREEGYGDVSRKYLQELGNQGSIAAGEMLAQHPALSEQSVTDEIKHLPFIRDYFSRQATLPELPGFESYQTAGPHFDEEGNIIPGQIPPVNAMKILSREDIGHLGRASNFGLKPLSFAASNLDWERENTPVHGMFPVGRAGFVAPATTEGMKNATAGNTSGHTSPVGIRGFGTPSDKAFFRNQTNEREEGIFTEDIPPERLVGVFGGGKRMQGPYQKVKDYFSDGGDKLIPPSAHYFPSSGQKVWKRPKDLLEVVHDGKVPVGTNPMTGAHSLYEQGKISPMDMVLQAIYQNNIATRGTDDSQLTEAELIHRNAAENWAKAQQKFGFNPFRRYDGLTGNKPFEIANEGHDESRNLIPNQFKHGVFGFENPLLTEEEKKEMMDQLGYQLGRHDDLDDNEREYQRDRDPSIPGLEEEIYADGRRGDIILHPRRHMRQI